MARLLRLLSDPTLAHQPGTWIHRRLRSYSLAAVAERARSLQRSAPSWCAKVQSAVAAVHRRGSGVCQHTPRSNKPRATTISTHSVSHSMSLPKPNLVEPPWNGPVCPVVGEGWHREVSPYPDPCPLRDLRGRELGQLGGFQTSRCLRSGSRPLAMTVKIGTSVGSAGALDDVECRDRTAKTL